MTKTVEVKFQKAFKAAAAKAGIDVSQVKHTGCATNTTWGDRVGTVFYGADAATNERAARFFETWYRKNAPKSSYEAQSSIAYEGVFHFHKCSNGAQGWYRGVLPPAPEPYKSEMCGDFVFERVEGYEGYAVSTTYYPGAD